MTTPNSDSPIDWDDWDAKTLAAWCARSSESYNVGAWQTALLLRPSSFRDRVASHLAAMDLPAGCPALVTWRVSGGSDD
ncbi:hypothetical protein GUY44_12135 [Pimelobacter simplex]|uniref:hypothetical protein n=1 Tax=Nocardioides simplex TaxID=2045 RepID=UPI001142E2E3|nr:hypothetical protein [Pimelobacter simplex]MCG8151232.1 hypothetical protein [Pimelobacter simplex]GEB17172.1 hypothetical protein NSI01_54870 [Pimelobacter simplex]